MLLSEKLSLGLQILTLVAATYIGVIQNQINTRQAKLQDFVAIAASPDASGENITLLNTGKTNLYIHKIIIGDQTISYDRPRLLATGTLESSYYWVTPPSNLPLDQDIEMVVYVSDEFGDRWKSEHGGRVYEVPTQPGSTTKKRVINTWSYRTVQE